MNSEEEKCEHGLAYACPKCAEADPVEVTVNPRKGANRPLFSHKGLNRRQRRLKQRREAKLIKQLNKQRKKQ